ncbi:btaf1 RNA polymerase II, B-TFIID transcription factor-associated, 170kDa [Cymbomonas tetramitiformis]|uniref:Btaf1 RNA polymerase II, B-TFIID transcription factor-associated, 170kDa n=1 Tax=Cymbomonas tetramitiformis TaxID=36881 RepID=A0AAE0G772_9CHLO|nr:btaf1 RNA polymerase II, B-TFIID transcription factor-associated, 170kDa [Cymbomonas tetramitiformis]
MSKSRLKTPAITDWSLRETRRDARNKTRVLIFAQLKGLLDIVEQDLFRRELPGLSYLRLDGSVDPTRRFDVVRRFNRDPTVDVLLLTTHVGTNALALPFALDEHSQSRRPSARGLGLNLTTADTVIFLEHDWNPQKDLQAMDRAHRLGQRRTVNVFRILTRNTLEEKIMGLQKFKLDMANAVVNQDNMSLSSMDTGQLLDLFAVSGKEGAAKGPADAATLADNASGGKAKSGLKAMLNGLEELWDENQYAEEFALEGFKEKVQSSSSKS